MNSFTGSMFQLYCPNCHRLETRHAPYQFNSNLMTPDCDYSLQIQEPICPECSKELMIALDYGIGELIRDINSFTLKDGSNPIKTRFSCWGHEYGSEDWGTISCPYIAFDVFHSPIRYFEDRNVIWNDIHTEHFILVSTFNHDTDNKYYKADSISLIDYNDISHVPLSTLRDELREIWKIIRDRIHEVDSLNLPSVSEVESYRNIEEIRFLGTSTIDVTDAIDSVDIVSGRLNAIREYIDSLSDDDLDRVMGYLRDFTEEEKKDS